MKKNDLLKILIEKYSNLKFEFKENEDFEFYLLYKVINPDYYDKFATRKFRDELDLLCEEHLSDKELKKLVIVYDYLDEIVIEDNYYSEDYTSYLKNILNIGNQRLNKRNYDVIQLLTTGKLETNLEIPVKDLIMDENDFKNISMNSKDGIKLNNLEINIKKLKVDYNTYKQKEKDFKNYMDVSIFKDAS